MKRLKSSSKDIDNDLWLASHFGEIVRKYGGKVPYVLIAKGKVFPVKSNDDIAKLESEITRKFGKPLGLPVPKPEDFSSVLSLIPSRKLALSLLSKEELNLFSSSASKISL